MEVPGYANAGVQMSSIWVELLTGDPLAAAGKIAQCLSAAAIMDRFGGFCAGRSGRETTGSQNAGCCGNHRRDGHIRA